MMPLTARVRLDRALLFTAGALMLACAPEVSSTGGGKNGGAGKGGGTGPNGGGGDEPSFVLPDAGPGKVPDAPLRPDATVSVGGVTRPCEGLECQQTGCVMGMCKQKACDGAAKTTVSGRVFDPAGRLPLYNVLVYVPNAPLAPIKDGPTCDRCDTSVSGKPIVATLTNTKGEFVLENVPVGSNIPLVLQVGKWRRQITVPQVAACADKRMDDPNLMRLPRNQKEGNIPRIALTTGGYDVLECLLRKIGLEDSEFTPATGNGRVTLYAGKGEAAGSANVPTVSYAPALNGGAAFTPATDLWADVNALNKYDMLVMSCEGNWNLPDKTATALQNLASYADRGGRVFASHWHEAWMQFGVPAWRSVAQWVPGIGPPDMPSMDQHDPPAGVPFVGTIDTSFPKGAAFAEWLVNVQASATAGQLMLAKPKHTAISVDARLGQRWIYNDMIPVEDFGNRWPTGVEYLTFNSPVGSPAGMECGRTVFTDIHISDRPAGSAQDMQGMPFPTGCTTMDLSPQEKALIFMIFELSSCVQPDAYEPMPPRIVE